MGWTRGDQRRAEILTRDVGIGEVSEGATRLGVSASEGGPAREVQVGGESLLRAVAARGNYWGQDRIDMQFAAKEIRTWRFTWKPGEQECRSAKRLARYLKDSRRVVIEYKFQKLPEKVVV